MHDPLFDKKASYLPARASPVKPAGPRMACRRRTKPSPASQMHKGGRAALISPEPPDISVKEEDAQSFPSLPASQNG